MKDESVEFFPVKSEDSVTRTRLWIFVFKPRVC